MAKPRLLLVPTATEIEWRIKPLLEEWADVASYDTPDAGPGVGADEILDALAAHGSSVIEDRGWDRCVVVGDEVGAVIAVRTAAARPDLTAGLAIGHAALTFRTADDRAAINAEVLDALVRVARTDYRSYVRALAQTTQHAYDEEFVHAYLERVPQDLVTRYLEQLLLNADHEDLESRLRGLDVPMLFVEHRGCLLWTPEGFEDAARAFPHARTEAMELKPSVNPEFASLLREFCDEIDWG